jgi:SET domain-containing protein
MTDVVVAKSSIHGVGVFAERDFRAGETILYVDDSRLVDDDRPLRPEAGEFDAHCDYLAAGRVVLMQSPERHINSSCDPNTFIKTIGGVRQVLARRRIRAAEEVTCDYIINCHGGDVWECHCGSERCRGTIVSSFFELPASLQLEFLPLLDDWFIREHEAEIHALSTARDG